MTVLGIGSKLLQFIIPYFVLVAALTFLYPEIFAIPLIPRSITVIIGLILTGFGLFFLIVTLRTFAAEFRKGNLITSGTFSLCRNPIYASWTIFIVPGIGFLVNSWLELTAVLLMYVIFKIYIGEEERILVGNFGEKYTVYRNSTPELFPFSSRKLGEMLYGYRKHD